MGRSGRSAVVCALAFAAVAATTASAVLLRPAARGQAQAGGCARPYAPWSPWNTPLVGARYEADSGTRVRGIEGGPLSSDPTQYTYPVYFVSKSTPKVAVRVSDWYSNVSGRGRRIRNLQRAAVMVPLPPRAHAAQGSDGQLIAVDRATGDEWGFWQYYSSPSGAQATNGYHYNVRWSAVPPQRFVSRGAGVPYLTGLVRPCEIRRGRIDHALAFAYPSPSPDHVYPATKSDGGGSRSSDIPEGGRLQLDPSISPARIRAWGCRKACFTIARALQRYGMYVIDNSGRPKMMMEYEDTAHWHGTVSSKTPNPIPLSAFKLVTNTTPDIHALASSGSSGRPVRLRYTVFDRGDATREVATVSSNGLSVARIARPFHVPLGPRLATLRWRGGSAGTYSFCVRATDPAGHASGASCASVTVR